MLHGRYLVAWPARFETGPNFQPAGKATRDFRKQYECAPRAFFRRVLMVSTGRNQNGNGIRENRTRNPLTVRETMNKAQDIYIYGIPNRQ